MQEKVFGEVAFYHQFTKVFSVGLKEIRCCLLKIPNGISRDIRKASIDAINEINQTEFKEYGDPEILSRISQYEMAYKMQISAPEVMDINSEPAYIHEMYGTKPGKTSFANNVLLARKLVENGVRFVQLYDWGWDTHGTDAGGALDIGLKNKCRTVDKAITALILDLKQRGLLDETLIVWGGEFGRTLLWPKTVKANPMLLKEETIMRRRLRCLWLAEA